MSTIRLVIESIFIISLFEVISANIIYLELVKLI
jgi:hypothetical protein